MPVIGLVVLVSRLGPALHFLLVNKAAEAHCCCEYACNNEPTPEIDHFIICGGDMTATLVNYYRMFRVLEKESELVLPLRADHLHLYYIRKWHAMLAISRQSAIYDK